VERVEHDLLSHLEPEEEGEENPLENPEMVSSFFDDNGNMMDEDEEGEPLNEDDLVLLDLEAEVVRHDLIEIETEEPKYCFINAAALSDEEFTPEIAASPLIERRPSLSKEPSPVDCQVPPRPIPRPRVPISKSFPDIIQTTILLNNGDEDVDGILKPNKADFDISNMISTRKASETGLLSGRGLNESLIADSLEEIAAAQRPKVFDRMSFDPIMTESVVSGVGISGEKPPESWIVDFNSFSLEAEVMEEVGSGRSNGGSRIPVAVADRDKSNRSSNSNSLAFFINIDEAEVESKKPEESGDPKKIFSMFVDIGKEKEKEVEKKPEVVLNKAVKNVLLDSAGEEVLMIKGKPCSPAVLGRKFPSPHLPHKSGEGMKKPMGYQQSQKDKIRKEMGMSMSMSSSMGSDSGQGQGQGHEKEQGNVSNRSSLHVANYPPDGSFTASSLLSSMEMSTAPEGKKL
jgi:hypothetical protein